MKNTILLLALFFFSFSPNSSEHSQNLTLEQPNDILTIEIHHIVAVSQGISRSVYLVIPIKALPHHLLHGDHIGGICVPPNCG